MLSRSYWIPNSSSPSDLVELPRELLREGMLFFGLSFD